MSYCYTYKEKKRLVKWCSISGQATLPWLPTQDFPWGWGGGHSVNCYSLILCQSPWTVRSMPLLLPMLYCIARQRNSSIGWIGTSYTSRATEHHFYLSLKQGSELWMLLAYQKPLLKGFAQNKIKCATPYHTQIRLYSLHPQKVHPNSHQLRRLKQVCPKKNCLGILQEKRNTYSTEAKG